MASGGRLLFCGPRYDAAGECALSKAFGAAANGQQPPLALAHFSPNPAEQLASNGTDPPPGQAGCGSTGPASRLRAGLRNPKQRPGRSEASEGSGKVAGGRTQKGPRHFKPTGSTCSEKCVIEQLYDDKQVRAARRIGSGRARVRGARRARCGARPTIWHGRRPCESAWGAAPEAADAQARRIICICASHEGAPPA